MLILAYISKRIRKTLKIKILSKLNYLLKFSTKIK